MISGGSGKIKWYVCFFFQAEDGIRDADVTGVQTCALPIYQVPLTDPRTNPAHLRQLESWLRSYRPQELFEAQGRLRAELRALAPAGERRMSANPHANGGLLLQDLQLPDFRAYAIEVPGPGAAQAEDTRVLGRYLRDVIRLNATRRNFRIFAPDETISNRLTAVFEATARQWDAAMLEG